MSNKIVSMGIRYAVLATAVSRVLALVLLAGLSGTPAAAQAPSAEVVLLLTPAHVEDSKLRAEIARWLRGAGLLALQVRDLGLDPVLAACRQSDCAAEAARAAGKAALLVNVSRSPGANAVLVELYWHDPGAGEFREHGIAAHDQIGKAAAALAQRVLQRRVLGARALLRVDTLPAGAQVTVDGKLAGLTPFEQAQEPGLHEVQVALPGFDGQRARVRSSAGDVQSLRLALVRRLADAAPATAARERRGASAANFVLGGALTLAALPLLISGINPVLNEGQCIASTPGPMGCESVQVGAREALLIGAGVVALGGAAVMFLAQPLRVQLEAAPHALGLRASGTF